MSHSLEDRIKLIPVIEDEEFERGKVPMTKSAIRHLSIVRLGIRKGDIIYDVGSGTGSIAVQIAAMDESLKVYAIEKKDEAINLIKINKEKFKAQNLVVVPGEAPEALTELEPADCVFVGGSGGNLREILIVAREKNPSARIVINAISLETISEVLETVKTFEVEDLIIEQIAVSKSKEAGSYHMMMAENPVLIASFKFSA